MNDIPIGVFDSGIGGITVLSDLVRILPGQKFIYFGDNKNAPYGVKDTETIKKLSLSSAKILFERGIKALVVACNTATSAAINDLREVMDIPVIGMEPALKLAVDKGNGGTILVMATPLTITEKKFNHLMENYCSKADIIPMACNGLVEIIEEGDWEGLRIKNYLEEKLSDKKIEKVTDVVLGCTHYIFIKEAVKRFFGEKVSIHDGNQGTARQAKKILIENNLYKEDEGVVPSQIEYIFSDNSDMPVLQVTKWLQEKINLNKK